VVTNVRPFLAARQLFLLVFLARSGQISRIVAPACSGSPAMSPAHSHRSVDHRASFARRPAPANAPECRAVGVAQTGRRCGRLQGAATNERTGSRCPWNSRPGKNSGRMPWREFPLTSMSRPASLDVWTRAAFTPGRPRRTSKSANRAFPPVGCTPNFRRLFARPVHRRRVNRHAPEDGHAPMTVLSLSGPGRTCTSKNQSPHSPRGGPPGYIAAAQKFRPAFVPIGPSQQRLGGRPLSCRGRIRPAHSGPTRHVLPWAQGLDGAPTKSFGFQEEHRRRRQD